MTKRTKKTKEIEPLALLLAEMERQGLAVQFGGFAVEAIPTDISSFDISTGIGGIPLRRVTILQGEEGSGKTLLLLALIAAVQRRGGRAAFIDAEHALTPSFATLLGVDYDSLLISRPRTMEEAYDTLHPLARSGLFSVVGYDSAVALAPQEALELKAAEGGKRAAEAQVHSRELKKLNATIHKDTAVVIVNQLRENPSPPGWWPKGVKMLYSPGGRALRHGSSMTVDLKTTKVHKDSAGRRVGHRIVTFTRKNKVASPYRSAEFDLTYAGGIDVILDMINTAILIGLIKKSSSWFYFDTIDTTTGEISDEKKWNGRDKMEDDISKDEELRANLLWQLSRRGLDGFSAIGDDPDEESGETGTGWDRIP